MQDEEGKGISGLGASKSRVEAGEGEACVQKQAWISVVGGAAPARPEWEFGIFTGSRHPVEVKV